MGDEPTTAEDWKAKGNVAFKEKKFQAAVDAFSSAIKLEKKAVYFSNRSGAYASMGSFENALADAEECVSVDATFAKGYSRKGAAFVGLGKVEDAIKAYEAGLKVDPENANMKAELARCKEPPKAASSYTSSGSSTAGNSSTLWMNAGVLLCTLFYLLPFFGPSRSFMFYKGALALAMNIYGMQLYRTYGLKFSALKDPRFLRDGNTHYFFLSLLLFLWQTIPFALIPIATFSVQKCTPMLLSQVQSLPGFLKGFMEPRLAKLASAEGEMMIPAFAAISELMVGVMLVVTLVFTGLRNVIMVFFYWQFLSYRYKSSEWTQRAFWVLRERLDALFGHRFCPAALGKGWALIKNGMSKYQSRM